MANLPNLTNKDQFIIDYDKQRNSFMEALKRFNSNKGTPFYRPPEIGGLQVDLYHLYQKVTSLGGWRKVNHEQHWENILADFLLPQACVNAVEALKQIYFRYLNLYEKVNFLGEDIDTKKKDDDDGPSRKKICLPIESIPMSYNYNQHKLSDTQRETLNVTANLKKKNPYEKLELSLQSGLPNDVDHAMNVCVLLSTEGRHTIDLHKTTCMIELLMAHIGIFEDGLGLEDLYSACWTGHTGRDFLRFWYESVKRKDIRGLITYKGEIYSQREMTGEQVLNLGRDIGIGDIEGQRVLQVAVFIRNLSFEECNQAVLASSSAVFKFLNMCLYNTYSNLRQLALDTIANLGSEISIVSPEDVNSQILLDFMQESLVSEDRFCLVRGMELLSKMCLVPVNKCVFSSHLRESAYSRLIDLLTIQDIQIIVHSLEVLYKLSKVGEPFTTKIAKVHKSIDILVSLITIEAQSFGPGSLVGIKVVEYVPPASASEDNVKRPTTVIQPVNPDSINIYQIPSSQLSHPVKTPEKPVQPPPKSPTYDIHTTTTSWLKASYEEKKKSKVNQVELFSEYLQFCRKFTIKNTLSSADFLQMVKTIFDQVSMMVINRKNCDKTDIFFEGLSKRQTQRPFAVTTIGGDSTPANPKSTPTSNKPGVKTGRIVSTPQGKMKAKPSAGATNQMLPPRTPNGPINEGIADTSPVKTLLAKKIHQASASDCSMSNTITSQPFAASNHSPGTYVVCPAVTSSQTSLSNRPANQGKPQTTLDSHNPVSMAPSLTNQSVSTIAMSNSVLSSQSSQLLPSPFPTHPSTSNNINSQPLSKPSPFLPSVTMSSFNTNTAQNTVNTVSASTVNDNSLNNSLSYVSSSFTAQSLHNGVPHSVVSIPMTPTNTSMATVVASQSQMNPELIQQQAGQQIITTPFPNATTLPVVQQQTQGVTIIPQHNIAHQNIVVSGTNLSLTGTNNNNVFSVGPHPGTVIQQSPAMSQQFVSQAVNTTLFNQIMGNQSINAMAVQPQQTMLASNMVVSNNQIVQTTGQQMVNPGQLQQGSTVMIQPQTGAMVVPQTQVLVQGNVGNLQQNTVVAQPGAMSFVVPQYRPTSNLIIQQGGAVNVMPSLAIQPQQSPLLHANPLQQTITSQLGNRQIIVNQSQLPVGMQVPSLPSGNVNLAAQQPAGIILQQSNQQSFPPTVQLSLNNNQVVQSESLTNRSDIINNQSHILHQQQQLSISTQLSSQQTNQLPNSHLVVQTQPQNAGQEAMPIVNGNHEVNGVLGSPDSMSSDLPPSPQSTGLQTEMTNGQMTDSDTSKYDLAKLVDKSGIPKINGIIHNFENDNINSVKQFPSKISPNTLNQSSDISQTAKDLTTNNLVNGSPCPSTLQQPGNNETSQRIFVNVQQRQQAGNNVSVNGINQQHTGNVVIQQHQHNSQQQPTNVIQRVVVNKVVNSQQQSGGTIVQSQQQSQRPLISPNTATINPPNQLSSSNNQNRLPTASSIPSSPSVPYNPNNVSRVANSTPQVPQQQRSVIPPMSSSCDTLTVNNTVSTKVPPLPPHTPGRVVRTVSASTSTPNSGGTVKRRAAVVAMTDKTPVRLRKKKEEAGVVNKNTPVKKPVQILLEYKCEWGNCRRNFTSAKRVFLHVFRHHIPKAKESCCQWFSCEKMVRKRWSLVSHIQDYHCTEMAMRSACHRRFTLNQNPSATLPPPPPQPMLYPPDAASQAIRRFIIKPPFPEFTEQREGPVSKHIRLTAALILRNICHHSTLGRKLISRHEQQLNYNCMNPMDASTALSSCLWDIVHYGEAEHQSSITARHLTS